MALTVITLPFFMESHHALSFVKNSKFKKKETDKLDVIFLKLLTLHIFTIEITIQSSFSIKFLINGI